MSHTTNSVSFVVKSHTGSFVHSNSVPLKFEAARMAHGTFEHKALAMADAGLISFTWGDETCELAFERKEKMIKGKNVLACSFKCETPMSRIKVSAQWVRVATSPDGDTLGSLRINVRVTDTETIKVLGDELKGTLEQRNGARAGINAVKTVATAQVRTSRQQMFSDRLIGGVQSEETRHKVLAHFAKNVKLSKTEAKTLGELVSLGLITAQDLQ